MENPQLTLTFFHLMAVIAGFGGSIFMGFILTPVAQKNLPEEYFHKIVAKVIRKFHPFLLLCYGILIMTGAWMLTDYKKIAGVNYFSDYGKILSIKLLLVFVAVMISSYQFFGLGTGIVYMVEEDYEKADKKEINRRLKRLRLASLINVGIILWIIVLGLVLSRS